MRGMLGELLLYSNTGAGTLLTLAGTNPGDYIYWNGSQWVVGDTAVSLGAFAGQTSQGAKAVAIGANAGQTSQQSNSVAIGNSAGQIAQNNSSVAVGASAAQFNQANGSVAVGFFLATPDREVDQLRSVQILDR